MNTEYKPAKSSQEMLDELISSIEEWRVSHGMDRSEYGHLLLLTDNDYLNDLFLDASISEKLMIDTRCPKFDHHVEKPIPKVPIEEAKTIRIGSANVVFSVESLAGSDSSGSSG